MVTIYITATSTGAGKTMVGAGIGRRLQQDGKKVGYLKLVNSGGSRYTNGGDSDTLFMRQALGLTDADVMDYPADAGSERLKEVLSKLARGKNAVLVEGLQYTDSADIIRALDARVLVVDTYPGNITPAEIMTTGNRLPGIVLNKVPVRRLATVADEFAANMAKAGIPLLVVIPEDRTLAALTVAEIADYLAGRVLNAPEQTGELVESLMLGAITLDSGLLYFGRQSNKTVLVRAERPDMQLAALQTSTRCLVIGGDSEPAPAVMLQAESKQVPLVLVPGDTVSTVAALEEAFRHTRFNQAKKLARLDEIMSQQFGYRALYQAMGLTK